MEVELGGEALRTNATNISCGGMFLKMDKSFFKVDPEELGLAIYLPNQKRPVKLVGEICRRSPRGVAVEFQGLYNDNILAIEKFVKSKLN